MNRTGGGVIPGDFMVGEAALAVGGGQGNNGRRDTERVSTSGLFSKRAVCSLSAETGAC